MGIIRLLLALSVLSTHANSIFGCHFVGGQMAVQSFYIISGFYMALILKEKYVGKNGSFKLFISNRFLRLYPIYLTILGLTALACIAVAIQTKGQSFPKFEQFSQINYNPLSFIYLIFANIIIFGQDLVLFLGISPQDGHLFFTSDFTTTNPHLYAFMLVPQAWSLGIELTFYLLAPFILRKSLKFQSAIILLSLALRFYLYNVLDLKNDPWTYRFFPTELLFFMLGSLAYHLKTKLSGTKIKSYSAAILLVYIIMFTVIYAYIPVVEINYIPFSLKDIAYYISIMVSIPILFLCYKNNKIDNQIGELSYPVYISHKLIIMIFAGLPFIALRNGVSIAVFTIIASILLIKFISKPIEKVRQSRLNK